MDESMKYVTTLSLMQRLNSIGSVLEGVIEMEASSVKMAGLGAIAVRYKEFAILAREYFEELSLSS